MPYFHFTARARHSLYPLKRREPGADLWNRLCNQFEQVLACVLMPNHVHLVGEFKDPYLARAKLGLALSSFSKSQFPGQRIWEPVSEPELLSTKLHLKRQVRYVHLNPCRARLAADPLEWEWSTHRDAVGAAYPCWLDVSHLAMVWSCRSKDLPSELHAYVSGDPSVRVEGTPLPRSADSSRIVTGLDRIEEAVLQATRLPGAELRKRGSAERKVAIHLVNQLGGRSRKTLGDWLEITSKAAADLGKNPLDAQEQAVLGAASLILSNWERFTPRVLR